MNPQESDHGLTPLPHHLSVLCPGREVELPAVSTERGRLLGRSVQHCKLLAVADDDGSSHGLKAG